VIARVAAEQIVVVSMAIARAGIVATMEHAKRLRAIALQMQPVKWMSFVMYGLVKRMEFVKNTALTWACHVRLIPIAMPIQIP